MELMKDLKGLADVVVKHVLVETPFDIVLGSYCLLTG